MPGTNPTIKTALISVSDKTGIEDFARALSTRNVAILSTGGTASLLRQAGITVRDVAEVTQFPEMMDGRLKTLHPRIHGGLLAVRGNEAHQRAAAEHGIAAIDLLVVNLYPFEASVARNADFAEAIENIDIGGPAMIRAAAKNHAAVTVVVDAKDYAAVLEDMETNSGATTLQLRRALAQKAYARTATYDAAISNWLGAEIKSDTPDYRAFGGRLSETMRYGENPHQWAAFYSSAERRPGVASARQVQGKSLSYNNLNDTDAAFELIAEFLPQNGPAIAIIKHANPCGVAAADSLAQAYLSALKCDPFSAFGGIVAANHAIDAALASEIAKVFTEVVIAPGASEEALAILSARSNLRVLLTDGLPDPRAPGLTAKFLSGGFLVQSRDNGFIDDVELKVVTRRAPTPAELVDLKFAFRVAKHVKSNAVVYARNGATVGIGAGQMSRVDSARIAAWKAEEAAKATGETASLAKGSVVASDAFFPFADGLLAAAAAGATAVIQPGGSVRDDDVIAAADENNLAMVLTGMRHFRH